ncbi:MAG TPA: glycoside hydrolase family 127 protein [Candidatus Paceibacterota bacterium]|nr:glycoside hydrolase family 127 protein [Candidatus Paceibacterota bacterium]
MNRLCTRPLGLLILATLPQTLGSTTVVTRPDTDKPNVHYAGNRAPLLPSPFIKLPLTAIRPEGWLRKQLELQAAGFHGHLEEVSRFMNKTNNAWLHPQGRGDHGWEEVPYWLKGFGDCAYLIEDQSQIREAKIWIEGAIASQQPDGWFGPGEERTGSATDLKGREDMWPNMIMLMCLQSYYEYSGDPRVLDTMRRYFEYQMKVPEDRFLVGYWAASRAADNLWSVHWLFNRTGEPWLLELAEKIQRRAANWTDTIPNWHNVNLAQGFGGPTFFWPQSKDPKHLAASERNWRTIRDQYGHVPGGMFGGDENCRPGYDDPRQAVETCGMVEMMFSHERLFLVTGNPIWADRCEDVAFNSLPAGLLADFKALRYLTAPNLILSDRHNKAPGYQNGGAMLLFDPYSHRCCQHNFGHGWPYFAEHLWTATPGNGLAAALYAPSRVRAKVGDGAEITISETTHYPFEERIEFTLTAPRAVTFPLYLRVPAWCANPEVRINGALEPVEARPLSFIRLERQWNDGDIVRLDLPMEVALRTWTRNHGSVSVDRGPLTYALKIGERYVRQGGTGKWPAWEIHPTTPWNFGLVLAPTRPASSFRLVKTAWPDSDMPFTHAGVPIALTAKGRRIPEWQADHLGLVGLLQDSPVRSSQPEEEITLIPMGAARLRIASFPVIGGGPEAHAWKSPPSSRPYQATASHVNESDTVFALKDDVAPKHSNDQGIPRFTWWDHKGTTEWVQYDFDAERQVSGVEVYWFDDTPGGGCGLPAFWRALYQAGNDWKPVGNPQAGPVAKDRFNVMTFEPVRTGALRLEVQLKPGLSGGILEWRVKQ